VVNNGLQLASPIFTVRILLLRLPRCLAAQVFLFLVSMKAFAYFSEPIGRIGNLCSGRGSRHAKAGKCHLRWIGRWEAREMGASNESRRLDQANAPSSSQAGSSEGVGGNEGGS
jgi:hypothetical protein